MNTPTALAVLGIVATTSFFIALSSNTESETDTQLYGKTILPYQYVTTTYIPPICKTNQQVIGRFIYKTCEPTETLVEKRDKTYD